MIFHEVYVGRPSWNIRDFKMLLLQTTDYGWTRVFFVWGTGARTQQLARNYEVKIADYGQQTTNDKMSFKKVRDALVYGLADGYVDEEEFVVLYDAYSSENPLYPYWEYDDFCLDSFDSNECLSEFRVNKEDLPHLAEVLQVPQRFRCSQGTVCSGLEGLCILLKRLAYPCRYFDIIYHFARPVPELCMIYNVVLDWMYSTHGHRLTSWNQLFLSPACLEQYAGAVSRLGSPLDNCFGFVDGTVRPISRPEENQRVVYNGHKRVHALKFQSLVIPNGLIANLYGPLEGRRHDAGMLNESGLLRALQAHAHTPTGQPLCIYGDPAYPLRPQLPIWGLSTQQWAGHASQWNGCLEIFQLISSSLITRKIWRLAWVQWGSST